MFLAASVVAVFLFSSGFSLSLLPTEELSTIRDIYSRANIDSEATETIIGIVSAYSVSSIIIALIYMGIEATTAASPGKRVMGMVVTRISGQAADSALWTRRVIVKYLSTILGIFSHFPSLDWLGHIGLFYLILFYIGCLFALGDERLALHDRILQTAVMPKEDVQP
jgi:uncharacterized RDD family membrane protein YckC